MIQQIQDFNSLYPTFVAHTSAMDMWEAQPEYNRDQVCFLRIYDVDMYYEIEFWHAAHSHKALKGISTYTRIYGATEYVLAFPTKADAMLFKLAHGG